MKKIETYDEFKILTVRRIPGELVKAHVRKNGRNGIVICGERGGIYVSNLSFSAIKIKRLTYHTQLDIAETLHLMGRVHENVVADIKLKIDLQEQKKTSYGFAQCNSRICKIRHSFLRTTNQNIERLCRYQRIMSSCHLNLFSQQSRLAIE